MRKPWFLLFFILFSAIAFPACKSEQAAPEMRKVVRVQKVNALKTIDCPFQTPEGAKFSCGTIEVPENYADPYGEKLSLFVVRIRSLGEDPLEDPVLFIDSDWGFSNMLFMQYASQFQVYQKILENRDLIFFEMRGLNQSSLPLNCPDYASAYVDLLGQNITPAHFAELVAGLYRDCREKLVEAGIRPENYTTEQHVADIRAVQLGIGAEKVNLIGFGYGADLALRAIQSYPDGFRSAVINSPYNPRSLTHNQAENMQAALDQVFSICKEDASCKEAFPSLEEDFYTLVDSLNSSPITIEVSRYDSNKTLPMVVTGDGFLDIARSMISSRNIAEFPKLVFDVKAGRNYHLDGQLQSYQYLDYQVIGAGASINCQAYLTDEIIKINGQVRESLRKWQQNAIEMNRAICEGWYLQKPEPLESYQYTNNVPALVLVGGLNGYIGPENLKEETHSMSNESLVELGQTGWADWENPCVLDLTLDFLDQPTQKLDSTCAEENSPVNFTTPLK